jgi:hypothetical protein
MLVTLSLLSTTAYGAVGINGAACGFATVSAAAAAAASGDVLFVAAAAGPYPEPEIVLAGKTLTIRSANAACTAAGGTTTLVSAVGDRNFNLNNATLVLDHMDVAGGAEVDGGAVTMANGSKLLMTHSVLRQGTATHDGGCVYSDGSTLELFNASSIERCEADLDGGGAYLDTSVAIVDATSGVTDNVADQDGGGLAVDGSSLVSSGAVDRNTAGRNGGGLALRDNGTASSAQLTGAATIDDNAATVNGGGVHVAGDTLAVVPTELLADTSASITANDAAAGGGIAVEGLGIVTIEDDVEVRDNTAVSAGGGLYAKGSGTLVVSGSPMALGAVIPVGGVLFQNNTADAGGGVYLLGSTLDARNMTFNANQATVTGGGVRLDGFSSPGVVADFENTVFYDNVAGTGGGISADAATLSMTSSLADCALGPRNRFCSEFVFNDALPGVTGLGGAIHATGGAVVTVEETAFSGNHASGQGSAVLASGTTTSVTLENTLVIHNTSPAGNTAVRSVDSALAVSSSTFANNYRPIVWAPGASGTLDDTIVFGNTNDLALNAGITGDCNMVQTAAGVPAGAANVFAVNPLYLGVAGAVSNYEVAAASPAVDACAAGPLDDLVEVPRPTGAQYDRGAFEQ